MKILIDNLFTETGVQKDSFVSFAEQAGEVIVSGYVRNLKGFEPSIPRDETLLLYGSIQFVEDALKEFPNAVAFYNQRMYACSYFMSYLPEYLFVNHDAKFFPLGYLRQTRADRLHKGMRSTDDEREYFVRSDSGRKLLAGKTVKIEELHKFDSEGLSEDSFVVVAPKKFITNEVRYFVHGNKIISRSHTHYKGRIVSKYYTYGDSVCEATDKFAQQVFDLIHELDFMDTIFVCDIAQFVKDGRNTCGIMEFNAASTSDMHLCNVTDIFSAMIDCIEQENSCM